jgi:hypothetical protein
MLAYPADLAKTLQLAILARRALILRSSGLENVVAAWGAGREGRPLSDDPNTSEAVLRGASDGLLIAIREVDAKEHQKRAVPPGDPAFGPLAHEVVSAAETVLKLALEEAQRADATSGTPAGAALPTINASNPRASLTTILDRWRSVERRLAAADPGSPESNDLLQEFEALRQRYAAELDRVKQGG